MGKICTFCQHKEPDNKCRLIESSASVEYTERCTYYEPVTNVAPVIHAHWTGVTPMVDTIMCSNCGWNYPTNEFATPYCPCCGAKMDEAEIVGKRMLDGFIDGMGNNVKSVGQKFINNDKNTVEHTIMGMKNEVTDETS